MLILNTDLCSTLSGVCRREEWDLSDAAPGKINRQSEFSNRHFSLAL